MAKQYVALEQILLKEQSVIGTAEVGLTATEFFEVEDPNFSIDTKTTGINTVGAGFMQTQEIVGSSEVSFSGSLPFKTGAVEGAYGNIYQALKLCGWKGTITDSDADAGMDKVVIAPSNLQSEHKSATVWAYSGNKDTSGSIVHKFRDLKLSGKISLDFDSGVAKLSVDGKAILTSEPEVGTQASTTASVVVAPSLIGATISFFGSASYIPSSIEFDFGQQVSTDINGSTAISGLGQSHISDRKISWTAKVYEDTAVLPVTTLRAGTLGTISVAWGTTPNKFTVASGALKAQIKSVKRGKLNGITTYELSGILVDNSMSVTIETVVGA